MYSQPVLNGFPKGLWRFFGVLVLAFGPAGAWAVEAEDDGPYVTDEDTVLTEPVATGVLANDDDEGDGPLTVSAHSQPANGTVIVGSDGDFTYTPDPDFHGSDTFQYTVVDNDGDDDTAVVSITVNPANDAPVADEPLANMTVAEDSGPHDVDLSSAFIDVDGDSLTYSASSGSALFDSLNAVGSTLTIQLAPDENGSGTVTVRAEDPDGEFDEQTFDVQVTAVNDAPVVNVMLIDLPVVEDSGPHDVDLSGTFSDIDGDLLTYSASSGDAVFESLTVAADTLTVALAANEFGTGTVTVRAEDPSGAFAEQMFNVNVSAVNDAPVVDVLLPDLSVAEDSGPHAVDLADAFVDVDGDTLTYIPLSSDSVIDSFAIGGSMLNVTLAEDENGTGTITVRAEDSAGAFAEQTFQIDVSSVNDAPVVDTPIGDQSEAEDSGPFDFILSGVFNDPDVATDSDVLSYSVSTSGDALFDTVDISSGTLSLDLAQDQHGVATVTVRATDLAGEFVEDTFDFTVTPVNDLPEVVNPIADVTTAANSADITIDLSGVFDDVDIATNGDVLTLSEEGVSNPALFDNVDVTGETLTLEFARDQPGTSDVTVRATDSAGAIVEDTFQVFVAIGVPVARDDAQTMDEDTGPILIDVLANDYPANEPVSISVAGDGNTDSDPTTILDPSGDAITAPNGTVVVIGDQIQYEPKDDFYGEDFFTYTLTDAALQTSTATVTVNVAPVNDPPVGTQPSTYEVLENGELTATEPNGLLAGAYDVDGALLDEDGNPVGEVLTIQLVTAVSDGTLSMNFSTGAFTYTPPVNFTGTATFSYQIFDGTDVSSGDPFEAEIDVIAAPEAPPAPPAGEVAATFNLAQVPLEQSTSVAPNVLIMMDDSGSMDWNMSVRGADDQGGFVIDNSATAPWWDREATTFYYLWDLPNNLFNPWAGNGRILPTEEALDNDSDMDGNQFGVWRARSPLHNRLYYNPAVRYTPWIGQDRDGDEFTDADPENVRLNPRDPDSGDTFNILADHSYRSYDVPRTNGDDENVDVDNSYIPRYYTSTATPPLEWDDPHEEIVIHPDEVPPGGYPGGPGRDDCAMGDGDPMTCTYEQEIQNFANFFQYYRTREYAAKNGLGKVIADVQDIRVGYETINDSRSEPVRDMNDLHTEGNKKSLMDDIYRTNSNGGTPLRRALDRAGDIFSGDHGSDPILPDPEGLCQQNFTLLFSDGYWNGGNPPQGNTDDNTTNPFDGGRYEDGFSRTLADVAMYFYKNDIRGGMEDLVPVSQRDRLGAPDGTFDDGGSARMHQHMKTFTVAFGVVGDVDPESIPDDPLEPFPWPSPTGSSQGKIDDMLHAAVNGRGEFLSAVNPQELQTALESAFQEFTQAASSTSSAAFNSTSLQEGTLLYRGFYDLRDFTGELTATEVDTDGNIATEPTWRASEQLNPANKLPNNRVLVSYDPDLGEGIPFRHSSLTVEQQLMMSEDEVDYIRGQRDAEQPSGPLRRRATQGALLGDIVNSSPVFVGEPRSLNRDQAPYPTDDLYSEFVDAHADRTPLVYVGANDGILHGFHGLTGEELFGYVPNKIMDTSQEFHNDLEEFTEPFYQHKFYVDLTPRLNDVYMRPFSGASFRDWNTVLVGGLGAGGKGFFALNVTDPGLYSGENTASDAVLWEFTEEDDTYPVDASGDPLGGSPGAITDPNGDPVKDLGFSLSLPTVAMSNVPISGAPETREWVAVFGNGPNSTAGIAKLFVLFMERGLDGWGPGDFVKLDTGFGVPTSGDLLGFPNGLGTPTAVDTDLNGTVDRVYAGDRLGNLFRFDLSEADPDDWTVTRLFTASYDDGGTETRQPILNQPLVVKHPTERGFLVIFGTGSYMTRDDADSEDIQSIYAIWDRGEDNPATALDGSKESRLVEQTITNEVDDSVSPAQTRRVVTSNPVNYEPDGGGPGTFGWYIDLDMPRATNTISGAPNPDESGRASGAQFPGEKAIRRFLFRDGAVITTTVLPSLDEFSCFGTRPGSILLFDAVTGGDVGRPVIDFNTDGVIDEGDLVDVGGDEFAGGLLFNQSDLDGALVDLSTLGGQGDTDFLFVSGGNTTRSYRIEDINDARTGRLSWRELEVTN